MIWICPMCSSANGDGVSVCSVCAYKGLQQQEADRLQAIIVKLNARIAVPTISIAVQQQTKTLYDAAVTHRRKRQYRQAMQLLLQGAELGSPRCEGELGEFYRDGLGVKEDPSRAFFWFQSAALQGDVIAQYCLGNCFAYGNGAVRSFLTARAWHTKAAEKNYAPAFRELGEYYRYGRDVQKNLPEAVKWYQKAALGGDAKALYILGECYRDGTGVAADPNKARDYFTRAAANGYIATVRP